MRAAASCDAPILRPTRRFTRWPPFGRPEGSFGFDSERSRFQNGVAFAAGSCSVAAGSGAFDFRPSESSFFQKGAPFTLGSRAGFGVFAPRESVSSFFQNGVFFAAGWSNGG